MIYETHTGLAVHDFTDLDEARAAVEAHKSGYIVKFVTWPDGQQKSCAMQSYSDGAWRGVDISR